MMMNEDEFIKGRVKSLREIAADADPLIKRRLLRLADSYARRLAPPCPPGKLIDRETKMPPDSKVDNFPEEYVGYADPYASPTRTPTESAVD
jgi:hypothetical protein